MSRFTYTNSSNTYSMSYPDLISKSYVDIDNDILSQVFDTYTNEEILDKMNINDIELYLRRKKIERIKRK